MKHIYTSGETFTVIHMMEGFNGWMITGVGVGRDFRGQGAASQLLKEVLDDADREGVKLYLSIEPDGTGLDEDQLRAWYARNGFVNMDPELTDIGMVREPRTSQELKQNGISE